MNPDDLLSTHFRLDENHRKGLARLGLTTVRDLLYYFPVRYSDISTVRPIKDVVAGDTVTIYGTITAPKTKKSFKSRMPMAEAWIEDVSGKMKVMWFNQAYIAKMVHDGDTVKLTGKIADGKQGIYLSNPEFERAPDMAIDSHTSLFGTQDIQGVFGYPVYPETKSVTSKWLYHAIQKALRSGVLDHLPDPIPEDILTKYNLPPLSSALVWIHIPKKQTHADSARKRFSFEEVFVIQLKKQHDKKEFRENNAFTVTATQKDTDAFIQRLPFTPTEGQIRSINTIINDLKKPHPMARLLEGDVGSGKTAVAAVVSHAVISSRPKDQDFGTLQIGYMAPTEILATQLFENFITYFKHTGISIALLTGSGCRKFPSKIHPDSWTAVSKPQLQKWIASGDISIVIGTHAIIQKSIKFKHLALVIIDEQHRFGTNQRFMLARGKKHERDREIEKTGKAGYNFLDYKDTLYRIKNALESAHKKTGPQKSKQEYIDAIQKEFIALRLSYVTNKIIPPKTKIQSPVTIDFVIENSIYLSLSQSETFIDKDKKAMTRALKTDGIYVGLVVYFGARKIEISKVLLEKTQEKETTVRESITLMPHLLSMTATPIPRTLALTIYGDLDVSIIDQMPSGRKPIITEIVTTEERKNTYAHIAQEMKTGRQLYVICPRINDPDPDQEMALQVKSVTSEAERLRKEVFPTSRIGVLHSKMSKELKEDIMQQFSRHELDILVATSVVEVGVNVPNATMIIIEGAERFGLAQLHQLRGRVIRGNHQAYCYLFADAKTQKTVDRLLALKTAKNGFELAELDLKLRGAGELGGGKQWGITDLGMEAIRNFKMVEAAREEAIRLIEEDKELTSYPLLKQKVDSMEEMHFE